MALGLQVSSGGGGGEFTPVAKYDARAGRFFRVDRTQGPSGWDTQNVEITNGFQAIFDLENIQVGYALFAAGVAPQWAMAPYGQPMPQRPSNDYKPGFKMLIKLAKSVGGDLREFASCAGCVIEAVDALHTEYEAGKAANPGKLPVVAMTGSAPVVSSGQGKSSTNYKPLFQIVSWVDRPAELAGGGQAAPAAQAAPQPAAQPAPARELAPAGEEF